MKYCPICDERYDEEIIRFCTKDGTPLVEDEQPNFTALPSESSDLVDDEFGQETVIRRKSATPDSAPIAFDERGQSERIVIPTSAPAEQHVRPRTTAAYVPAPPENNTARTIALTIFGTVAVLGLGAVIFWSLQNDAPANININTSGNLTNQNVNLNTNLGFDSNFNFNANSNFNSSLNINGNFETNINANVRPTTPTPRPSPRPTTAPTLSPTPSFSPTPRPPATIRPANNTNAAPSGTPRIGPRPPAITNRPAGNGNNL